ncbi:unnamed protein product [Parascedosporium putredinis]|uniref:N-acetyltransferase domain-containing protein n=1 Tax=Parascedosporium putredinis TaxID=1442378 RepID=A0A9P1M9X1_9PEZI|nr:unnamed protein product [Parascedosporium putredinis]CAI7991652.1 unnamed protein product [Parascedosporium putredinis]
MGLPHRLHQQGVEDATEHESDSVLATEETLLNTIAWAPPGTLGAGLRHSRDRVAFPARPSRCILVFTPEGVAVGMALYFYNYSTWRAKPGIYLEDLYVKLSERKRGYGFMLLQHLAREVVAMDGGRLEWSVLKWNEPSIKFYESIGAKRMDDWVGMRVDGEALVKLAGDGVFQ